MPDLKIAPKSVTLQPNGSQAFQISVNGAVSVDPVKWTLTPAKLGTLSGHGVYVAPRSNGVSDIQGWLRRQRSFGQ